MCTIGRREQAPLQAADPTCCSPRGTGSRESEFGKSAAQRTRVRKSRSISTVICPSTQPQSDPATCGPALGPPHFFGTMLFANGPDFQQPHCYIMDGATAPAQTKQRNVSNERSRSPLLDACKAACQLVRSSATRKKLHRSRSCPRTGGQDDIVAKAVLSEFSVRWPQSGMGTDTIRSNVSDVRSPSRSHAHSLKMFRLSASMDPTPKSAATHRMSCNQVIKS